MLSLLLLVGEQGPVLPMQLPVLWFALCWQILALHTRVAGITACMTTATCC